MASEAPSGRPPSWGRRAIRVNDETAEIIDLVAPHIPALRKQKSFSARVNWVLKTFEKDLLQMASELRELQKEAEGKEPEAGKGAQERGRRMGLKD